MLLVTQPEWGSAWFLSRLAIAGRPEGRLGHPMPRRDGDPVSTLQAAAECFIVDKCLVLFKEEASLIQHEARI